ncbi:MAG: hypothetical protein WC979_05445 [Candidatus Pacearchaeota archaeon]|jgi:hypothetical protein
MKNKYFRYLGLFIIFTGLIGLLFVIGGDLMGYTIFNGEGDYNSISGMAILGDTKNNLLGYIIFGVILALGLFVAFLGRSNDTPEKISKKEKSDDESYALLDSGE